MQYEGGAGACARGVCGLTAGGGIEGRHESSVKERYGGSAGRSEPIGAEAAWVQEAHFSRQAVQ